MLILPPMGFSSISLGPERRLQLKWTIGLSKTDSERARNWILKMGFVAGFLQFFQVAVGRLIDPLVD